MSNLTIALIILFFVILLCKPTYAFVYNKKTNMIVGISTPLIIALVIKFESWYEVRIVSRTTFENCYEYTMKLRGKEN